MKKFIIKSSIIFIFSLLFFRFTFISLVNNYEQKFYSNFSESNRLEIKQSLINSLKKTNEKERILYPEDAEIIGTFIRKIIDELKLN